MKALTRRLSVSWIRFKFKDFKKKILRTGNLVLNGIRSTYQALIALKLFKVGGGYRFYYK